MTPAEILAEQERKRRAAEEAARERNTELQQGAQPTDVLPKEQSMDGADSETKSYQRQGSVGGGSQTGTSSSTSSVGNLSSERQAEMEARQKAVAAANGMDYDPVTGKLTPKNTFITDILGVDPAVMRKKREEEQALNRRKQKESALYNALSVLGDMITTAGGGNVWKRDADKHAKEAHDANMALDREQLAEDLSNAEKLTKVKQDAIDKINAINMQYNNLFAPREQKNTSDHQSSQWSQGASEGSQGSFFSDDYLKQRYGKNITGYDSDGNPIYGRGGNGGGKAKTKTVKIPYDDANGTQHSYNINIPEAQYEAMGRYVSAAVNRLSKDKKDSVVKKALSAAGIKPNKNGTYNPEDLLASGIIFDDPTIRAEFEKVIMETNELSPEGKQMLIQQMHKYPVSASEPEKKSWWRRTWERITGEKETPSQPAQQGRDRAAARAARG